MFFLSVSAPQFYNIVRMNLFDWTIFNFKRTNLGRLNINYLFQTELDYSKTQLFFYLSHKFIIIQLRKWHVELIEDQT